jgi:hypothetical protein
MSMMSDYVIGLICMADTSLEQDAIEWAILSGWFEPTYNSKVDRERVRHKLPEFVIHFCKLANQNSEAADAHRQLSLI